MNPMKHVYHRVFAFYHDFSGWLALRGENYGKAFRHYRLATIHHLGAYNQPK